MTVIAQRGEEERNTYDAQGRLRLILEPVTFGEVLDAAFDMLRHAGAANATVLLHMVDTLGVVGREATWPEARRALSRHAGLTLEESRISPLIEEDRRRICQGVDALQAQLVAAR